MKAHAGRHEHPGAERGTAARNTPKHNQGLRPAAKVSGAVAQRYVRPGVIQRMRGIDLQEASEKALSYVGVEAATEVQAMHVDGEVAMTANNPLSMKALNEKQEEVLMALLSRIGHGVFAVKNANTAQECATKLGAKDHSLVILKGGDGALHAEQYLLLALAYMLMVHRVPQTVHVWGAKPPCGSCKAVLGAFSKALDIVYDKTILYSGAAGQDRGSVPKLSLKKVFGEQPGDFGRFLDEYEKAVG